MIYKSTTVPLTHINLDDQSYRITTTRDKTDIAPSVRRYGLLVPPALIREAGALRIVSGFRRIRTSRRLGQPEIAARLLSSDLRPLDCARIAVTENAAQRPLNLIETARAVQLVSRHCPPTKPCADELAMLGLPNASRMVVKLQGLLRLADSLQAAIVEGWIALNSALEIGELAPRDQQAILEFLSTLRMSVSKQKEVLSMMRDIAGRDGLGVGEVLQSPDIRRIIEDEATESNQKTALVRKLLKKIRYPNLSQAQVRYDEALRTLRFGAQIRLEPPPAFEGETHTMHIRFRNREELETAYLSLGRALQQPALDALFADEPHGGRVC
jgi:ParB family chromosome partitioning protein